MVSEGFYQQFIMVAHSEKTSRVNGIIPTHTYSINILEFEEEIIDNEIDCLIELKDPHKDNSYRGKWNNSQSNSEMHVRERYKVDKSSILMTFEEFQDAFDYVTICNYFEENTVTTKAVVSKTRF